MARHLPWVDLLLRGSLASIPERGIGTARLIDFIYSTEAAARSSHTGYSAQDVLRMPCGL
jgi:hypothetical protein